MRIYPHNEKETLKARQINLTLSDFEVDALCRTAITVGATVEELLEDFIGNLVGGYHAGGSDEERLAVEYFERVSYSFDNDDESYLQWLSNYGHWEEIGRFEIIEEESGEDEDSREEIKHQRYKIEESFKEYLYHIGKERAEKINREEELQRVRDFVRNRKTLRG